MSYRHRLSLSLLYAIAMAWFEAAAVIYLRTMVDRINPHQADPLPLLGNLGSIELIRELATLIMLLCVGWICGRSTRSRLAFTALAFGTWDIFYYLFLRVMGPWPTSLLDWDILFLLPLPWWGPVLAPVLISILLILLGILISYREEEGVSFTTPARSWTVSFLGALLALSIFMRDALAAFPQGREAITAVLPVSFNWPLFVFALLLMASPILTSSFLARHGERQ